MLFQQLIHSDPYPPTHSFLYQSSDSKDTLKLWAWQSPPCLSPFYYFISRLLSDLCLAQPFIKFPNYLVPLHSDLHPCSSAVQHQVDTQSILLINADDSWLEPLVPFSCWEYHFRRPYPGEIHSAPLIPFFGYRPAKLNLRPWWVYQESWDNSSLKAEL